MGAVDRKARADAGLGEVGARAPDALGDGLSDGLSDPLAAGTRARGPDLGAEVGHTARQLASVVGAPGSGAEAGETELSGLVGEATADHARGLD